MNDKQLKKISDLMTYFLIIFSPCIFIFIIIRYLQSGGEEWNVIFFIIGIPLAIYVFRGIFLVIVKPIADTVQEVQDLADQEKPKNDQKRKR